MPPLYGNLKGRVLYRLSRGATPGQPSLRRWGRARAPLGHRRRVTVPVTVPLRPTAAAISAAGPAAAGPGSGTRRDTHYDAQAAYWHTGQARAAASAAAGPVATAAGLAAAATAGQAACSKLRVCSIQGSGLPQGRRRPAASHESRCLSGGGRVPSLTRTARGHRDGVTSPGRTGPGPESDLESDSEPSHWSRDQSGLNSSGRLSQASATSAAPASLGGPAPTLTRIEP